MRAPKARTKFVLSNVDLFFSKLAQRIVTRWATDSEKLVDRLKVGRICDRATAKVKPCFIIIEVSFSIICNEVNPLLIYISAEVNWINLSKQYRGLIQANYEYINVINLDHSYSYNEEPVEEPAEYVESEEES